MVVRIITVRVKPGGEGAFETATLENRRGSVEESGVLRFDVLRDADAPGRYFLCEAYRDEAASAAHKETVHYAVWRKAVADLMAGDRTSVACIPVAPLEESLWRTRP